MSQPYNQSVIVPKPGPLDSSLKEFWVGNPWQIMLYGHNLSAFERNRVFLNVKGQEFLEVSHLSGADSDGDGRAVVPADFRNCGKLDLLVRQAGGGVVLLYENQMPQKHYLQVSLRGRKSNRLGIGARLTAEVKGERQIRDVFPANCYFSQAPLRAHFGLGDNKVVDTLTILWPSGKKQILTGVEADRHILVDEDKEGAAAVETVVPGRLIAP